DFATLSFKEQVNIVANTDILIGAHRNDLSHILVLPPSATAIELFPSSGFTWDYALLAKIREIDYYGHFAGDWVTSRETPHHSRFVCHGNLNAVVEDLDLNSLIKVVSLKASNHELKTIYKKHCITPSE